MKKLLSLIVVAVMVLSILPMGAMAAEVQKEAPAVRPQTIEKPTEGIKAPGQPAYRAHPLSLALNAADSYAQLAFTSEGDYPWGVMEDGDRSYGQSSNAGIGGSSSTVTATFSIDVSCILSFEYIAMGEGTSSIWDKCIFMLDGVRVFEKGQESSAWTAYTVGEPLAAGEHTIEFTYSKDSSFDSTGDFFAIDEVKLTNVADITPTPAPTEVPENYLDAAMNAADTELVISFESTGTYPWIVMTDEADRVYAMSGNKGVHSSSSTVTATFTLEAPAILSFDYMAWGESSSYSIYDKCIFKLDGTEIFSKGAENNAWDTYTVENTLFAGDHTIEFTFTKDSNANGTGDYFKIDNVKLTDASSVTPTPAPTPIPDGEDTYYLAESIEAGKEYLIVNSDQIGSASALIAADASTIAAGGVAVSSEGSNTIIRSYVTDAYVWTAETKASGAFILKNNGVNKYLDAGYSGLSLWGSATSAYTITYSNSVLKVGSYTVYWNGTAFAASVSGSGNIYLFVKNGTTPDPTPEPTPVPEGLIAGYYFESEQELEAWTAIDADNDSYTWQWIYDNSDFQPYEGNGFFGSASWDSSGPLVPNNYAIVGPIQLLDYDNELTFYAAGLGAENCAEHFEVLIGLSADPVEMGVLIEDTVTTADYVQYSADLDDYAGNEVYIAFHHFNCTDMYWLRLDQVEIWGYEREDNTILIEQINVIRMTEPAYGEEPYYEAQPANSEDPYTVSLVEWYCDDEPMQEGDLFDNAEAEYYAIIYLDANEGYVFAEVPEALVNGSEEYVIEAVPFNENTAFGIIWGTFTVDAPVDDEIINTVEILDFVAPAWGENPNYTVNVPNGAHYSVIGTEWEYYFESGGYGYNRVMTPDMVFDNPDYNYRMRINLEAAEGYSFNNTGELSIIIDSYAGHQLNSSTRLSVFTDFFTVSEPIVIDTVEILDFVEPAWGEAPFYGVTVPEGANYTIDEVNWYYFDNGEDWEPMAPGAVFDNENAQYMMGVVFSPNEGCEFAENPMFTINGAAELVQFSGSTVEEAWLETIVFTVAPAIIEAIAIEGFIEPAWGEVPFVGVTVPEGANYTLGEVYWAYFDGENWNAMDDGELFDNEEYSYCLMASFIPNEGYMFAAEIEATINGSTELAGETTVWTDLVNLLSIEFTVTASAPENIWGDANGDGETTIEDALLLMRYMIGLAEVSEDNLEWCDVNGDGIVDLADALLIMRKAIGTVEAFPVETE